MPPVSELFLLSLDELTLPSCSNCKIWFIVTSILPIWEYILLCLSSRDSIRTKLVTSKLSPTCALIVSTLFYFALSAWLISLSVDWAGNFFEIILSSMVAIKSLFMHRVTSISFVKATTFPVLLSLLLLMHHLFLQFLV